MIKKKLEGKTTKEQLIAKANDKLYNFLLAEGQVRGAIVNASHMVKEMRNNHELGILETLVLGQAYVGGSLMTANLKENGRISFTIECSGPIKGLSVEANAFGEVRGYLKNVPIPLDKPLESFDLSSFFGTGFLTVVTYPEYAKHPYTGQVALQYGRLASDLANYFLTSEQTPTSFNLSVKFDSEGNVTGAGGLFLQAMPGADGDVMAQLEKAVNQLPSIGDSYEKGENPEDFVKANFHEYSPQFLGNHRVEFFCRCNKKNTGKMLGMMPKENLQDILENGPFPVETRCHNCNTVYSFEKSEIVELAKK